MADLRKLANQLQANGMRCNCDFDSWEPAQSTGHTHNCRIHDIAWISECRPHDLTPKGRALIAAAVAAMSTPNKGESK